MTHRMILTILIALGLAGCSEVEAPVGKWEAFSESQTWQIAVRLETHKNNVMRASALSAYVGDADLPRRHDLERELRQGMKDQWSAVPRSDIAYTGNTITQKTGYAPLFVYEPNSKAMVFHFYAGGKLTEKVTLRPVKEFAR